jgi:hypothetical protein
MAPGPWITRDLKECVLASDYDALAAENAALKAQLAYAASTGDECAIEVEALRKDAERYRWLRDATGWSIQQWLGLSGVWTEYLSGKNLDAAIDAAMGESHE